MAGGSFVAQNKVRPGAYVNFKGVPESQIIVGARGIVTMPICLKWGATGVTEITSVDYFTNGTGLKLLGLKPDDELATPLTEALKYCSKALVYRLDSGATKASGTQGNLTATAKYAGTFGNKLSLSIVASGDLFVVNTLLDGVKVDSQVGANVSDLTDNEYVVWSGTGAITAVASKSLTSGTDGAMGTESTAYEAYFNAVRGLNWNTMALLSDTPATKTSAITYIKDLRDNTTKKPQIVIKDAVSADSEGVISTTQGYKIGDITISAINFTATVAGLTAGADVVTSNTYRVIDGATEIADELSNSDIESALNAGKLVLSRRTDDTIVIEQDINTLQTLTNKNKHFKKNRVIRCLDDIAVQIATKFENAYIGKVDNNATGRDVLKSDVYGYLLELQTKGAITNLSMEDIEVVGGNDIDAVVVNVNVQPVDSMEKLYLTVTVG